MAPNSTPPEQLSSHPPSPETSTDNGSTSSSPHDLCKNLTETFNKHIGNKKRRPASSNDSTPLMSVYLRIRPSEESTIEVLPCRKKIRSIPPEKLNSTTRRPGTVKEYPFEKVFDATEPQEVIFNEIASPLLQNILENKSTGLIFAYGSTNAGKTYTIFGPDDDWGILPRSLEVMLNSGHNVEMSYLEIYNEQILDLLAGKKKLKLREDRRGKIYPEGLSLHPVKDIKHGLHLAQMAKKERHTSSNNLNESSSRSHSICQLQIDVPEKPSLYLVDLAGAERSKRTNTRSFRLREANQINSSLSKLNKCIDQLQKQQTNVSFRESKLTHLFMNHFLNGGTSNTAMIVNANPSPEDYDETQSVLGYASVAKSVKVPLAQINKRRKVLSDVTSSSLNSKRKRCNSSTESGQLPKKKDSTTSDAGTNNVATKVAKITRKLSPRAARKRKMELDTMRRGTSTSSSVSTNVSQASLSLNRLGFQKEIQDLHDKLQASEKENQKLKEDMADREFQIRSQVAREMQEQISAIREHYAKSSKPSYVMPTPSKSVQKLKADRMQHIIDELVENVEECEEEMERMREKHEDEINKMQDKIDDLQDENERLQAQLGEVIDEEDSAVDVAMNDDLDVEEEEVEVEGEKSPMVKAKQYDVMIDKENLANQTSHVGNKFQIQ